VRIASLEAQLNAVLFVSKPPGSLLHWAAGSLLRFALKISRPYGYDIQTAKRHRQANQRLAKQPNNRGFMAFSTKKP
jgi:hypothetical protein